MNLQPLAIIALGVVSSLLLLAFQLGDTVQAAFDARLAALVRRQLIRPDRPLVAGDLFAGIAYEECDNSSGAAGAVQIKAFMDASTGSISSGVEHTGFDIIRLF